MSTRAVVVPKTRERIIDAALDLFVENGFAGTPITAIERAVGLAAGTGSFHRHFRSKEDLLRAAVEYEVQRCLAEIASAQHDLPVIDDPAGSLARAFTQTLADIRRFDRLFRLMLTEREHLPGLQATMTEALGLAGADSWDHNPEVLVAVAALGGYHFLGLMQGRPFQGVPQEEFIGALAGLIGSSRRQTG